MEDTQEITEETQETTEEQPEQVASESIEDLVKSEQAKKAEGAEKDAPVDESKAEPEKKAPVKLSAKERIQQLVDEKKSLTESYRTEVDGLKSEIAKIREEQKAGDITKVQAEKKIETAEDRFKGIIDKVEISDDLKPYKDDLIRLSKAMAQEIFNAEIAPIRERLNAEAHAKQEADQKAFVDDITSHYEAKSKDYTDLFNAEADPETGLHSLKPEIDKLAEKLVEPYYVPIYENGKIVDRYNTMLGTKEGINHLFDLLSGMVNKSQTLKQSIAQQKKIERAIVETPDSRRASAKDQSIEDMVKEEQKKRGG